MWLIKLHIAVSVLCIITFIGFKTVCKEVIIKNGWLSDKAEKKASAWLIFFVPLLNIICVLALFTMICMEKTEFDTLAERKNDEDGRY